MGSWIDVHRWMLVMLARLTFNPVKEAWYPVDRSGRPDLRYYRDDLAHYVRLYEMYLDALRERRSQGRRLWTLRTHAQWGLIAKGPAAAGYAAALLRHAEASAREDGAAILGALVGDDAAVDVLVGALQVEQDLEARDAIVVALGRLRNRRALPALAALVEDEDGDGDTRWTAVESVGLIARRRFIGQVDPVGAAREWLRGREVR
ncbi:HEAT repeat domain-containing protein [Agrilutibacter solisilvae]|uniref:HEAT repeat domain-containing protein n=1 Tax=Agrilutibacter solisilvae TaxID=2763317 RepID=A0A974XYP6_9GAMM|nr:HEAT repeat domain-containing protein [Lysobacter solisilvae]QSX78073.1 HEAT repeat domain-containing protein [Lysobacter solisilvae]